jgi:hypothetical protein
MEHALWTEQDAKERREMREWEVRNAEERRQFEEAFNARSPEMAKAEIDDLMRRRKELDQEVLLCVLLVSEVLVCLVGIVCQSCWYRSACEVLLCFLLVSEVLSRTRAQ